ncbi:asparaginase, partial [Hansschlegelia beijingensis]|uniref:asparaginase n=1 Tax=Hansschlegelia beijingensis TaxID=1133344 RepID=UPI00387F0B87
MTASAPLVEVTRGLSVESRHTGAVAIADVTGKLVFSLGDAERLTFPRSGVKALQGLPLVESGAAARFGLTDAELALACASHGGEAHVGDVPRAQVHLGGAACALHQDQVRRRRETI